MTINKVFLSYSRTDGADFALRLTADLKKEGFDVWIDQEDIIAGREWDLEIEKALETCDCLLFIETANSVKSSNVLDEVYYALEQKKKVIPLIVVDSKTPYRLQRIQHIDFTSHYHAGLALLIKELQQGTDVDNARQEMYMPDDRHIAATQKKRRRIFWVLVPSLFLLILFAVIYLSRTPTTAVASDEIIAEQTSRDLQKDTVIASSPNIENSNLITTESSPKKEPTGIAVPARKATGNSIKPSNDIKEKTSLSNEMLEGDWNLSGVAPKAMSSQGYLKVTALAGGEVSIKSYVQMYYPKSNDTLFLSIFNAYASCASCKPAGNLKLTADDVSVGSQYYQVVSNNQQGSQQSKDTTRSVGSNKSIRAIVSLTFLNEKKAELKIQRPDAVELSQGLVLQPFSYSFTFTKPDY